PNQGDEGESQIGFETAGNRHHLVFLFIHVKREVASMKGAAVPAGRGPVPAGRGPFGSAGP
ncbi:MAG: hypothetical protein O7F56_04900, partial [Acidobacteria bacterium]|nr:hypothetical protein [Acidobacteriota bacterium]